MRTSLLALFVLTTSLVAAPVPVGIAPGKMSKTGDAPDWSQKYAQQMLSVVTQVSTVYIRPVSRTELLLSGVAGLYEAARQTLPPEIEKQLKLANDEVSTVNALQAARTHLGNREELKNAADIIASCRTMLRRLDPHSDVVLESERKNKPWGDQPAGLGMELAEHLGFGPHRIVRVLPGTPAQRAGLQPGDVITHLNRKSIKALSKDDIAGILTLRSAAVTRTGFNVGGVIDEALAEPLPVTVQLSRPGREKWSVTLEHQERKPESVFGVQRREDNSWEYFIDRDQKIAHIRLDILNGGTATELTNVVESLHARGLRGLILDLRWSAGGFLEEATGVAGLFLGDKLIAKQRKRGQVEEKHHNIAMKRFEKVPLVVLINGQTSGGSELIAASLQYHQRAVIAGQRSLGKASVQVGVYLDLPGVSAKVTNGEFVLPNGKRLHRKPDSTLGDDWGIRPDPDLDCRVSPQLARELKLNWELQTLRPGSDNTLLPMDDPKNDPQRQVALSYLQQRLKK